MNGRLQTLCLVITITGLFVMSGRLGGEGVSFRVERSLDTLTGNKSDVFTFSIRNLCNSVIFVANAVSIAAVFFIQKNKVFEKMRFCNL